MFEIDPTGLTYHPLDDTSWKTERIPWERVPKVRFAAPPAQAALAGEFVYFDYEEAPVRNWFTRAYDLVAGRRPGDPEPLRHAALPLMLSSMPEDELFQTASRPLRTAWVRAGQVTRNQPWKATPRHLTLSAKCGTCQVVVAGATRPSRSLAHAGLDLQ
jgi:hypothetical protein